MTKKQLSYIIKICPQSVDCGKHCVKPSLMKTKMLGLPQNITQTFIDYGKSWRRWSRLGDLIIREESLPYRYRDEEWEESLEEEREEEWEELRDEFKEYNEVHDLVPNTWVDKDTFLGFHEGYIYKISKKSTGEFYVGQTKYNPIFRWGQHLTTDRFCMENIEDYVFEILETIRDSNNLGLKAREAYWINHEREKCPEKCLNTQIPDAEKWEEKLQEGNQTNLCTE